MAHTIEANSNNYENMNRDINQAQELPPVQLASQKHRPPHIQRYQLQDKTNETKATVETTL